LLISKFILRLAFDRARRQAPNEITLKDQESQKHRDDRDERAGHPHIPLRDRLQVNKPKLERQREPVRVTEHDRGEEIGVPSRYAKSFRK